MRALGGSFDQVVGLDAFDLAFGLRVVPVMVVFLGDAVAVDFVDLPRGFLAGPAAARAAINSIA